VTVQRSLLGSTVNADHFDPQATVTLDEPGASAGDPQLFEAMSKDVGNVADGFHNNFAYGALTVAHANEYVKLVDSAHNSAASGAEAVYVGTLSVPSGATFDLNGLHLYARVANFAPGSIVNGSVSIVPDGGPVQFATLTPAAVATSGEI